MKKKHKMTNLVIEKEIKAKKCQKKKKKKNLDIINCKMSNNQ